MNDESELNCFKSSRQQSPGVLVAISIPIFTSQLEKAREATDLANIRSAYAEAAAEAITTDQTTVTKSTTAKMQSNGAIDKIASEECGPWKSADITIAETKDVATVKGTYDSTTGAWTWTLSGGATTK